MTALDFQVSQVLKEYSWTFAMSPLAVYSWVYNYKLNLKRKFIRMNRVYRFLNFTVFTCGEIRWFKNLQISLLLATNCIFDYCSKLTIKPLKMFSIANGFNTILSSCERNSAFQVKISLKLRFVPVDVETKRNWIMSGVLAAVIPGSFLWHPFRPAACSRTSSLSMH